MKPITRRDAQEGAADLGIQTLYQRWVDLRHDINTTKGRSDDQTNLLVDELGSLERQMAGTPARSLRGVVFKLRVQFVDYAKPPSALADLERLAGVAVVSSDPPLMERILELEPALTDLEGASSALSGAASEDVPHDCDLGVIWLSGKIAGSVHRLRKQFETLHLAAGGAS